MPQIRVHFPDAASVRAGDEHLGETNTVLDVPAGEHVISLVDVEARPGAQTISLSDEDPVRDVWFFDPSTTSVTSPIADLYNGLTLGAASVIEGMKTSQTGYEVMFERSQQLFAQHGAPVLAQVGRGAQWAGEAWLKRILLRQRFLADHEPAVARYYSAAVGLLLSAHRSAVPAFEEFVDVDRLDIEWPAHPPDQSEFDIEPDESGFYSIDQALAPLFDLMARSIRALDRERTLAFVVMPFSPPFPARFCTVFEPSLREAGCRAVRALGMLSGERYQQVLHALLARVGFVLADVTGAGRNVLYEVGATHAHGTPCLQIADAASYGDHRQPTNVASDFVLPYASTPDPAFQSALSMLIQSVHDARLARPSPITSRAVRALMLPGPEEVSAALRELVHEASTAADLETVARFGALHADPRVSTPHLLVLGWQQERDGDLTGAEATLRTVVDRDPQGEPVMATYLLASVLCRLGRSDEGIALLEDVAASDDDELAAQAQSDLDEMRPDESE